MSSNSRRVPRKRTTRQTGQTSSPSTSGWHPEDIKAAIRKSGLTLGELAARHGYSRSALYNVVHRRGHAPGEAIIAAHLGVTPQELWPHHAASQGRPIDLRLLQHRAAVGQVPSSKRRRAKRTAHREAA